MHFDLTTSRIRKLFYGYYAALIRGEALIKGRYLFQCGYQKVRRLLEDGASMRPYAYLRKYSTWIYVVTIFLCIFLYDNEINLPTYLPIYHLIKVEGFQSSTLLRMNYFEGFKEF